METLHGLVERLVSLNPGRLEEEYRVRELYRGLRVEPPIALRLDGVGWGRRLRSRYQWPRDERVHRGLARAAVPLLAEYGADLAYVTSDEVSVLWLHGLPFSGRVEKLDSIAAGLVSANVSLALGLPLFLDSRVVKLYSREDAARYILYRARVGFNNYVSSLYHGLGLGSPRETPGLHEMLEELLRHGVDPLHQPWAALGSCVARALAERRSGTVTASRRRIVIIDTFEACIEALSDSHRGLES